MAKTNLVYNDKYREACFYVWYNNGRPRLQSAGGRTIVGLMPLDERGEKPGIATILRWMADDGWEQHADVLDAEVSMRLDKDAIEKRVETLRELAANGKTLKDKGLAYLNTTEEPFKENPSAAVRAIVAGSEMEFKYAGQADMLVNIAGMSNKQLDKELARYLGKNENEIIDAEAEDSPSDASETNETDDADTTND